MKHFHTCFILHLVVFCKLSMNILSQQLSVCFTASNYIDVYINSKSCDADVQQKKIQTATILHTEKEREQRDTKKK